MAHCLKCEGTSSWVKEHGIFRGNMRRLRVCRNCQALFRTVEVTLPNEHWEEIREILEMIPELPKQAHGAETIYGILKKTLQLTMMAGNRDAILGRLAAIVDEYPLPVVEPDPDAGKMIPLLPGDEEQLAIEGETAYETVSSGKRHRKSMVVLNEEFRNAFSALEKDGSVSIPELMTALHLAKRSVYDRVEKMNGEFIVNHSRVYRAGKI